MQADLHERVLHTTLNTGFTIILQIRTLSDNPCVHVLWPTVHRSAFPEAAF